MKYSLICFPEGNTVGYTGDDVLNVEKWNRYTYLPRYNYRPISNFSLWKSRFLLTKFKKKFCNNKPSYIIIKPTI